MTNKIQNTEEDKEEILIKEIKELKKAVNDLTGSLYLFSQKRNDGEACSVKIGDLILTSSKTSLNKIGKLAVTLYNQVENNQAQQILTDYKAGKGLFGSIG